MHDDVEDGDEPHADVGEVDGEGLLRSRRRSSIPSCCRRLAPEFPRGEPLGVLFEEVQMNLVNKRALSCSCEFTQPVNAAKSSETLAW